MGSSQESIGVYSNEQSTRLPRPFDILEHPRSKIFKKSLYIFANNDIQRDDFLDETEAYKAKICDDVNQQPCVNNLLSPDDLVFKKGPSYDWGMKNESPLEKVPFFDKNSKKPRFHKVSATTSMFPANPAEFGVRLFNKNLDCKNESW